MRAAVTAMALCSVLATGSREAYAENRVGIESDVIGWATGGYHVSAWFGTERVRVRAVKALFSPPAFTLPDGFDKLENDAWEFFLDVAWAPSKNRFDGIWSSIGLELYDRTIHHEDSGTNARFSALDLALRAGYIWHPFKTVGFYLNPWIGLNAHLSGPERVSVGGMVGGATYDVPRLAPLGSLKVGYQF